MRVSPRACRHCGSPAKGNPCWWSIKPRNWCGDPPCVLDRYTLDFKRRDIRQFIIAGALAGISAGSFASFAYWLTR